MKTNIILQKIVFPINPKLAVKPLYYNANLDIKILSRESIFLVEHTKLDLCTFFNAFSATKWRHYTNIEHIKLDARISGSGKLRLMQKIDSEIKCISERLLLNTVNEHIEFFFKATQGFYYIELEAFDEKLHLHEANFSTELEKIKPIKLAVVMCTFKRELYIYENITQINNYIFENQNSILKENLDIFLVDNGQTLAQNDYLSSQVSLIPNENIGGSGGFTRGLIEVLHKKEEKLYTHVIFMDDDINFDIETLERTYSFLYCLKPEFQNTVLGGIMLHNEKPCIMQPVWDNWRGKISYTQKTIDFKDINNLISFDTIKTDYQPWWYCCYPLSMLGINNLPLPFFIHGDDVEYGLRNHCKILLLNGICVWHDAFENKRSSHLEYYDIRNYLIINSIYNNEKFALLKQIMNYLKRSTALIFRMRYNDINLIATGIQHFLNGPVWWAKQNISELHQQIVANGYQYKELPTNYSDINETYKKTLGKLSILKCILTLNGAFFPKTKKTATVLSGDSPYLLYRRKSAYLLDSKKEKAIYVEFSLKKFVTSYMLLIKTLFQLVIQYKYIQNEYKRHYRQLGTEEYWKQHFKE